MRTNAALLFALLLLQAGAALAGACVEEDEFADPAASHCKKCTADKTRCEECHEAFGPDASGVCVACNVTGDYGDRCVRCDGEEPGFCLECKSLCKMGSCQAVYADSEGRCVRCPEEHCRNCTSPTGVCSACNRHFGLVGDACQPCADEDNCLECGDDVGRCTQCSKSTWLASNGTCLPCVANCLICEGADKCGQCDRGFAFSKAGDKCEACGPNCADCETPGVCTSCEDTAEASTVLIDGRCEPCPDNCNTCTDTKTCTECNSNFGVVNGSCVACAAPECLRCDGDPAKCSKCSPGGADAASGTCKDCAVANCEDCSDNFESCNTCSMDGFVSDGNNGCKPCTVENCKYCYNDPQCAECKQGYYREESGACKQCTPDVKAEDCAWAAPA